jgi:hypothetical protein
MSKPVVKKLYRIITQTEGMTITAETSHDMTESEARNAAEKDVLSPNGKYKPYVLVPICTEFQWKYGQINFCPRCGHNISEYVGGDNLEGVTESLEFECPQCEAEVYVNISNTPEQFEE